MEQIQFINSYRIRSVVAESFTIKKELKQGWFSSKEEFVKTLVRTFKADFEYGKMVKSEDIGYYPNTKNVLSKECKFFQDGKLIERTKYNSSGSVEERETYNYINGVLNSSREDTVGGVFRGSFSEKQYDDHGNMTYIHKRMNGYKTTNSESRFKTSYQTTDEGYLYICEDEDHEKTYRYYDRNNKLIKKVEYDSYNRIKESNTYTYDALGNEISRELGDGRTEYSKYDNKGNLIWMSWYKDGKKVITEIEYSFDVYGNWIEYRQIRDGVFNYLIKRDISYI